DTLLRRLAGAVPRPRGLRVPLGDHDRAALDRGGGAPDRLALGEADLLHLAPDRDPLDAAAVPLRPADAPRVERAAPGVAGERRRVRCRRAGERGTDVSIPLFLVLAALTIASALVVVVHRNPVYSALGLVGTLFLLSVFFVGLDAPMVAVL